MKSYYYMGLLVIIAYRCVIVSVPVSLVDLNQLQHGGAQSSFRGCHNGTERERTSHFSFSCERKDGKLLANGKPFLIHIFRWWVTHARLREATENNKCNEQFEEERERVCVLMMPFA